jgi:nucleoside-diphosphate-sugar epimerase
MRVFVAGAAGAIGRQLIPMLIEAGHEVTGTTRSSDRAAWLEEVGAHPAMLDVFDAAALERAVLLAQAELVIHQLTDLAGGFGPAARARNARIRMVGTRNLIEAALAAGSRRVVAQSIAWLYAPGSSQHDETDPLREPSQSTEDVSLQGVLELERLVTQTSGIEGVVLRYGRLYGPGTGVETAEPPAVHVRAAARAALLAVDLGSAAVYNIVDDDGPASNARAKAALGWLPSS